MQTIQIKSLDTIREAAKEFVAGMDDRTVFAFRGVMGAGKNRKRAAAPLCRKILRSPERKI